MLQARNPVIESAYSGDEALSRLAAGRYDLVLADIYMPGMDGLTLLNRIREIQPDATVIIMTAQTTPATIIQSISNSAYGYLSKPFTKEALVDLVLNALSTRIEADDIEVVSARPGWVSMEVRCKMKTADRLTNFFREFAGDLQADERDSICAAFRELLMNAIEHGGKADPDQKVSLTYVRTSHSIIYYIRDPGEGFSFEQLTHAAVSNAVDAPFEHAEIRNRLGIRPGGFGILMTKNFADELLYSEKGNEVMFIKYLPQ
jgi:CheY-like chemotaxis protein/anti-sigma regulatory factor (Ser/Thr protein kinase)